MRREKSCGAVVFRRNRTLEYLLLHYNAGHWDFVKGQVEANENEKETVMRELGEETEITAAQFVGDFREKISYFFRREGETIFKEVAYYLILAQGSKVKISSEHIGYEWLSFEQAIRRLTFKNTRDVLKKAKAFLRAKTNVN